MPAPQKKAYSYIRFSSLKQELGDSLRRQLHNAEEYAAQNNLYLDTHSYRDLGVSAFKSMNAIEGKLGTFLKAVDDGLITPGSTLIVESLDRLSRASVDEALELFLSIIRRGIVIVTLLDKQTYSKERLKEDKGMSLIISLTYMMRAHEESVLKAGRVKEAWDEKRAKHNIITSVSPSWLSLKPEIRLLRADARMASPDAWAVDLDRVETIKQIFEWAANGVGTPTIANRLSEQGFDTLGEGENKAKTWGPAHVMALLKNKAVIGTFTPKKAVAESIENYFPPIIKPEVFHKVQEHIANRRGSGGPKGETVSNLFSGILRCQCGSKMRFVSSSKNLVYVRCLKAYSNTGCDAAPFSYSAMEDYLLSWICGWERVDLGIGDQVLEDPSILLRGELESARKRAQTLVDALGMAEGVSMPTIVKSLGTVEAEITRLEEALRTARVPTPTGDAVHETYRLFKLLPTVKGKAKEDIRLQMRAALRRLLTKIVVHADVEHQPELTEEERQKVWDACYEQVEIENTIKGRVIKGTRPRLRKGEEYRIALAQANAPERWFRSFEIHGPLVPLVINRGNDFAHVLNDMSHSFRRAVQGEHIIHRMTLPDWGINGTRKRRVRAAK